MEASPTDITFYVVYSIVGLARELVVVTHEALSAVFSFWIIISSAIIA